jgi:hypothetical protein
MKHNPVMVEKIAKLWKDSLIIYRVILFEENNRKVVDITIYYDQAL